MEQHTLREITDAQFQQEVLASQKPVLVDFWAPWCGPCRMMAPVLEETARELDGSLEILKVNTDQDPRNASQLGVMGIPTMVLFHNGEEVDRLVGAVPKTALRKWLEARLPQAA